MLTFGWKGNWLHQGNIKGKLDWTESFKDTAVAKLNHSFHVSSQRAKKSWDKNIGKTLEAIL